MHFRVTSDANANSGVGELVDELSGPLRQSFVDRNYGSGLLGIVVVLMCRDPDLKFERRLRLDRKDKKLYLDVMLDLTQMRSAAPELRQGLVASRMICEIPNAVRHFEIESFELAAFLEDLKHWFGARGINAT